MTTLIATIILLGVLIFIHELGHYLAARSIGVRVERFSVGYPPRLMTFTSVPDGWEFRLFFYRKNDEGKLAWGTIKSAIISRPWTERKWYRILFCCYSIWWLCESGRCA